MFRNIVVIASSLLPKSNRKLNARSNTAPTVPADWAHPDGVELCGVFQSSDANAVLQYVTELEPDAVLDAWEPLLGGYALERSSGMGSWPILNAHAGDLEFAIQTDGDTGAIVIGFAEGAA